MKRFIRLFGLNKALKTRNVEDSVGLYTVFLADFGEKAWIPEFIRRKAYSLLKTGVKERYRECLSHLSGQTVESVEPSTFVKEIKTALLLHERNTFFFDRIAEWKEVAGQKTVPFLTKDTLQNHFDDSVKENDRVLFKKMEEISPLYFLRKMQLPTLSDVTRTETVISTRFSRKKCRILDYGCGAADVALFFAKQGHDVTICDIEGANLEFAKKRFSSRQLPAKAVPSTSATPIPFFEGGYDVIVALEVVEHVRNPLQLLEVFYESLHEKGVLIMGTFPFSETNSKGDHLQESVSLRTDLLSVFKTKWRVVEIDATNRTFEKRVPNV